MWFCRSEAGRGCRDLGIACLRYSRPFAVHAPVLQVGRAFSDTVDKGRPPPVVGGGQFRFLHCQFDPAVG